MNKKNHQHQKEESGNMDKKAISALQSNNKDPCNKDLNNKDYDVDFSDAKTIVVKVGTHTISNIDGTIDYAYLKWLSRELSELMETRKIVLVTSGAIGAGISERELKQKPRKLNELQATAAIGQGVLFHSYHHAFKSADIKIAQVLLAQEDFSDRRRYLNVRNSIRALLSSKILPLVNENDVVATKELRVGDNDQLAAMLSANIGADLMIMLSNVDGLYDKDPGMPDAKRIPVVKSISEKLLSLRGKGKGFSLGGIRTKILAADICMKAGLPMILVDGRDKDVFSRIFREYKIKDKNIRKNRRNIRKNRTNDSAYMNPLGTGTIFIPEKKRSSKQQWMSFASSKGKLYVDSGAEIAIREGKSLLPSGVVKSEGSFDRGDLIEIIQGDRLIAKGLTELKTASIEKVKGLSCIEASIELRWNVGAVILKDNMVMIGEHDEEE